jgi:hypothetical protein
MGWGLIPYWAKDIKIGFSNINAKAEGIENKPAFREAFRQRRCLVPVDNFYEWKKVEGGKQPYDRLAARPAAEHCPHPDRSDRDVHRRLPHRPHQRQNRSGEV